MLTRIIRKLRRSFRRNQSTQPSAVVTVEPSFDGDDADTYEPAERVDLERFASSPRYVQRVVDLFKSEWATQLPFEGVVSGKSDMLVSDPRLRWSLDELGGVEGRSVLELGPLEGAHTYLLEQAGASRVVAVEANARAFLKCLLVQQLLQLQRSRFLLADCIEFMKSTSEQFDVIVAHGILYHLVNPTALIELASKLSPRITLWTHYYDANIIARREDSALYSKDGVEAEHQGFRHTLYRRNYADALQFKGFCGGTRSYCNWMTRDDILRCLQHFGYERVKVVCEDTPGTHGPSFALAASR